MQEDKAKATEGHPPAKTLNLPFLSQKVTAEHGAETHPALPPESNPELSVVSAPGHSATETLEREM